MQRKTLLAAWAMLVNLGVGIVCGGCGGQDQPTNVRAAGYVTVSPANLTFGSQTVNSQSSSQAVTLTNTGTAEVAVSGIEASLNFSQTNNCAAILAGGAHCSILVSFAPIVSGDIDGTLAIMAGTDSSSRNVVLKGQGASSGSHFVSLIWNRTSGSGVAGYNIYRSTVSGGYYGRLNSSLVSGTAYSDSSVASGATYYYVVTAVNSQGQESAYSDQANAVVP